MRGMGFGAQGQRQSDQCAISVGRICRAEIKVSLFAIGLFGYQMLNVLRQGGSFFMPLWWTLLQQCGYFVILYATVLCHEFGHGNMARYLGGEIDHILLWVFGGICFSTRPQEHDNRKILRNDLLIVAAGPSTHFVQVALWGFVLCLVFMVFPQRGSVVGAVFYKHPMGAFLDALKPMGSPLADVWIPFLFDQAWGSAMLWSLTGTAIQLNVALFLFNVFFPMYPADGSKLLVSTLMFCCGVPARTAALVLLCVSVPCGFLFIGYSAYTFIAGVSAGQGGAAMLNSVMGFMGVMSLVEAYKIYELRRIRRLNTHPLFQTARSWNRVERDGTGRVHRINTSEFDDEAPMTEGACCEAFVGVCGVCCPGESRPGPCGCLACIFPCLFSVRSDEPQVTTSPVSPPAMSAHMAQVRAQREARLLALDQQTADRRLDVRDLQERQAVQQPQQQQQ